MSDLRQRYTMVCMKVLEARYCYYVLAAPIMTDAEYDQLEDGLRQFEKANPTLRHPNSPTGYPGSDNPGSYPRSVRSYRDAICLQESGEEIPTMKLTRPTGRTIQEMNQINQEVIGVPLCVEQLQLLLDRGEIDQQGNPL